MNVTQKTSGNFDDSAVLKVLWWYQRSCLLQGRFLACGRAGGTACGTFLDMLIIYFSIVLICFLLQLFHRGLRIGLL